MTDSLDDVVIPNHPCPPARHSLAEWREEAEQLPHMRLVCGAEVDAEAQWAERDTHSNAGADAVITMARRGVAFEDMARRWDCTVEEIAWPLARSEGDVQKIINVERCYRQHPDWAVYQIARECGVWQSFVRYLLIERLGVEFGSTASLKAGGGRKYPPETYEAIRSLRAQGQSYGHIGRVLSIPKVSVAKICERRGFTKGDGTPQAVAV